MIGGSMVHPLRMFTIIIVCVLLLFVACGEDGDDDDTADDGAADDDAGDDDQAQDLELITVDPAYGGCSVQTEVLLSGRGFSAGMQVSVGALSALEVQVLGPNQARAVFPAVEITQRRPYDVYVTLDGQSDVLGDAFYYRFDEDPVLLVHGITGSSADFDVMYQRLIELGYPADYVYSINFSDSGGSNIPNARDELGLYAAELLARTNAEKVDVVAHSMGAISTRLWIQQYGGDAFVRDVVTLAGASHGSSTICLTLWLGEGADEMCPSYADEQHSHNSVQWMLNGDPAANDVDETPFGVEEGGTVYWQGAFYSNVDMTVTPPESACLNQSHRNDCSHPVNIMAPGLSHDDIILDVEVFDAVVQLLREHNSSKP
ncbi:MAG: hypothetical protein P9M14_05910 [Candidatus Alcyoniella australis]|nr:hypothetical protein [Candidatus Alcyoniella australis]